jgi:hypothetical protein
MISVYCSCHTLMELEFSRQILKNSSNIRFIENRSIGSRVVSCGRTDGQTDRYDKANSRFL